MKRVRGAQWSTDFSCASVRRAERSISFTLSQRIHSEARRSETKSAKRSATHSEEDA